VGGSGPRGGNPGVLDYGSIELGKPGRGGNGIPGGTAGVHGEPGNAVLSDPFAMDVREHPGLRLVGVRSGASGDGKPIHSSVILGTFVLPESTAGEDCGDLLPAGRMPLPAASYRGRYHHNINPGIVSEFDEATAAGCLYLDTGSAFGGVGYIDPGQACVTIREVSRYPEPLDPRGYTETIVSGTGTSLAAGKATYTRAAQFLLREAFCGEQGNLVLPGSAGFSETWVEYDSNGDPTGAPSYVLDHVANGPPIYPIEVERTRNYCCKARFVYPNGRLSQYVIGTLQGSVCR